MTFSSYDWRLLLVSSKWWGMSWDSNIRACSLDDFTVSKDNAFFYKRKWVFSIVRFSIIFNIQIFFFAVKKLVTSWNRHKNINPMWMNTSTWPEWRYISCLIPMFLLFLSFFWSFPIRPLDQNLIAALS